MIELGKAYRDSVTGYTGVATSRGEHLDAPPNVLLEHKVENGKANDPRWFAESRLVEAKKPGPKPKAAPAVRKARAV